MCGIVGYIGYREAQPILINGLKRLEYRGYDSAGVALFNKESIKLFKSKGKVLDLEQKINGSIHPGATLGLGHTRWATHGIPSDENSHPHVSNSGRLVLVHNGIIENYESLKTLLLNRGYRFSGETDSEVLVNFIEEIQKNEEIDLGEAVRLALNKVTGAYAIAVYDANKPEEIIVARLGSPLVIGVGKDKNEHFIGSDINPFLDYTNHVVYLDEGELGIIHKDQFRIVKIKNGEHIVPAFEEINLELQEIQKGDYEHFMKKEIHEQPKVILDTLRGRLSIDSKTVNLAGMLENEQKLAEIERVVILGCGSSYIAGLFAEYILEEYARVTVKVEYASEFRYRNPVLNKQDMVVVISQSGETADTLAALKMAKESGLFTFGICNVVGSSIARLTDAGIYTRAGMEIGVASTKALISQFVTLYLFTLNLAQIRNKLPAGSFEKIKREVLTLPEKIKATLKQEEKIREIARIYAHASNFLYLGRKYNYPMAFEGALKLKEISYIHAEGYAAGEMKHGPIALVDEHMPVVVIATEKVNLDKIESNIKQIRARNGRLIGIVRENSSLKSKFDHFIEVPESVDDLMPILSLIPLQLLAYYIALENGRDVDQPRNLAKSVTVE